LPVLDEALFVWLAQAEAMADLQEHLANAREAKELESARAILT